VCVCTHTHILNVCVLGLAFFMPDAPLLDAPFSVRSSPLPAWSTPPARAPLPSSTALKAAAAAAVPRGPLACKGAEVLMLVLVVACA
jgi:hypothetical protein